MKLALRLILLTGISLLGWLHFSDQTFAGCEGWFSFASNCQTSIYVCGNGECGVKEGVSSVGKWMDGLLTDKPISQFIQDVVKYLLSFISIIGVIYIIYAGFQLMIGAGDEEKMKKAKQIILYVVIGIVVMWLAYGIVNWTIKLITKTAQLDLFITETYAYSENQGDTFNTYKIKLQSGIEAMESELRVQGSVSQSSIQNVRNLVQEAYIRLPDTPEYSSKNESAKRAVDMYLDLASKNPGSQTHVGNAISNVSRFISEAKIGQITGNITASPNS